MPRNTRPCVVILLVAAMVGGCIQSRFDPTLMYQYQRHVVRTGPQQRQADALIRQVPGSTGEPLPTEIDPETGKTLVLLTIDEAVRRALYNNPSIQVVGYDPAVAREDVVIAEAEFDVLFNTTLSWQKQDVKPSSPGAADQTRTKTLESALGKRFVTGGQAEVSYSVSRASTDPISTLFNPVYSQSLSVQLTQPLLRNAGPDVNLAQVRVARINETIAMDQFRQRVLDTIAEVQIAYWSLYAAREELAIRLQLVERSKETLALVRARQDLDADRVQITDAESVVANSRLEVINARRRIDDARDRLVRLMADASITLLDEYEIVTVTAPSTTPLILDAADQVAAALRFSPELSQARKAIEIQDINVRVARNQVLPVLDLTYATSIAGVDPEYDGSWNQMWGADYLSYTMALSFEYPLGNRARRANLRKARYNRAKSIATVQDTADQVAQSVNESVRQVETNYDLIVAGRDSLRANLDNLEALEIHKSLRQALTPDFLNRLLNQQVNVAQSQLQLLSAVATYNSAQTQLARVTGTLVDDVGVLVTDAGVATPELLLSRTLITGEAMGEPASEPTETDAPDPQAAPSDDDEDDMAATDDDVVAMHWNN